MRKYWRAVPEVHAISAPYALRFPGEPLLMPWQLVSASYAPAALKPIGRQVTWKRFCAPEHPEAVIDQPAISLP